MKVYIVQRQVEDLDGPSNDNWWTEHYDFYDYEAYKNRALATARARQLLCNEVKLYGIPADNPFCNSDNQYDAEQNINYLQNNLGADDYSIKEGGVEPYIQCISPLKEYTNKQVLDLCEAIDYNPYGVRELELKSNLSELREFVRFS